MRLHELFTDIGKLDSAQLQKGQALDPSNEGNFIQVSGRIFHKAVTKMKEFDSINSTKKGLDTLAVYAVPEYNNMKCYLGVNNTSGYCIAHGDELVSVFSTARSSGNAIVKDAIKNGARRLDCYASIDQNGNISGPLYTLYTKHGFHIDKSVNRTEQPEIVNGVSRVILPNGKIDPTSVVIYMER